MKTKILTSREVLKGYDAVLPLYSYIPPLSHWRAWEYAAYRHFRLGGRVLDLGCGDGRYFNLIWPKAKNVVGVDMEPEVANLGRLSGVYQAVHVTSADKVPEIDGSFDHVFANCSLEHMDNLGLVLKEIHRCLKNEGSLICSVVTNRFMEWAPIPSVLSRIGLVDSANNVLADFSRYHHLANPLSVENWVAEFERAGLVVEHHIPILPKNNAGMFLLIDNLWHIRRSDGNEIGDDIFSYISKNKNFPRAFRKIFDGLMEMEDDLGDCCGAVFKVRKLS